MPAGPPDRAGRPIESAARSACSGRATGSMTEDGGQRRGSSRRGANHLRDIRERKQATVTTQLGAGEREPSRTANQRATRTQLLVGPRRRYVRGREGDGDR